jgi:hypothetical protein
MIGPVDVQNSRTLNVEVFWVMMSRSAVVGYQHFSFISLVCLFVFSASHRIGRHKAFQNVSILPHRYTASQPRRPRPEGPYCELSSGNVSTSEVRMIATLVLMRNVTELVYTVGVVYTLLDKILSVPVC